MTTAAGPSTGLRAGEVLDAEADAILKRGLHEAWNAGFRCACDCLEGRLKGLEVFRLPAARAILGVVRDHLAAVRSRVPPAANPQSAIRNPQSPLVTLGQGDYTRFVEPKDLLP